MTSVVPYCNCTALLLPGPSCVLQIFPSSNLLPPLLCYILVRSINVVFLCLIHSCDSLHDVTFSVTPLSP